MNVCYTLHTAGILSHVLGTAKRPHPHTLRPANARCLRLSTFSLKGNTYLYQAPNLYHNASTYLPATILDRSPTTRCHTSYLPSFHTPNPAAASSLDDSNFTASLRRPHSPFSPSQIRRIEPFQRHILPNTVIEPQTPPNTTNLQPHPANTIHHARHTPLYPHPYRHSDPPPPTPHSVPQRHQIHKKPERKILSGFCLRVMLSRIILQARAVR